MFNEDFYVIFTNESKFSVSRIYDGDDLYYKLVEYTKDSCEEARYYGKRYAHLFSAEFDEYENVYYKYVTSVIL